MGKYGNFKSISFKTLLRCDIFFYILFSSKTNSLGSILYEILLKRFHSMIVEFDKYAVNLNKKLIDFDMILLWEKALTNGTWLLKKLKKITN